MPRPDLAISNFLRGVSFLPAKIELNLNFSAAATFPPSLGILIIDWKDFLGLRHLLN